jgi:hypothetical protein
VPRQLVHRTAVAEVLVTGWRPGEAASECVVDAQWPRDHGFYSAVADTWHDPLLALETVRQASMVAAFTHFGAEPDTTFLVRDLHYRAEPEGLLVGPAPAEIATRVRGAGITRRGPALRAMETTVVLTRDGTPAGTGFARFNCLNPAAYQRVRGDRGGPRLPLAPPVPPASVGRHRERDVVLAATTDPQTWLLRADPGQPTLFDHPVDHVPGMALVEAARQGMHLLHGGAVLPLDIAARFVAFVEHNAECRIRATGYQPGQASAEFAFEQGGRVAAAVSISVRLL